MKTFGFIWVFGYSAYLMGMWVNTVGTMPKCDGAPYDWRLPLAGLCAVVIPLICAYSLGFHAGKEKK